MDHRPEPIAVLLVDDDRPFTELTAAYLERSDDRFEVASVETPAAGTELLDGREFDCIVSDYDMPGTTGIEFLEAVREAGHEVPFLLFTGKGSEEIASEAITAGVTDYLRKTGGVDQFTVLANRVRNAASAFRIRREAARTERLNSLIRDVTRRLVGADGAGEVERTVCETIAGSESYECAWVGHPDAERGEIRPTAVAGDSVGYLEEVTVRYDDSPVGRGPGGRALSTGEVQLVEDVAEHPAFGPWESAACEYGLRSVVALPIGGGEIDRRVLVVYADEPYAFGGTELDVLGELADTIGDTLRAVETRTRLEERNRQLESERDRFEAVFEAMPYPAAHVTVDGDEGNTVSAVNSVFAEVFGCDRTAAVGRPINDLIVPEGEQESAREIDRQVADGEDVEEELTRLTAEGPRRFLFRARDFETGAGRREALGVYVDITDRDRRERELERNVRIIEAAGDPVYTLDADANFTYVNRQLGAFTGHDPEELVGEHVSTVMRGDDLRRGTELIRDLLADPERERGTLRMSVRTADGREIPTENHIAILPSDDGFAGTVGVVRDVTERLERERTLERQNERLEAFSSIVGHDLRNPLAVAKGHLELARGATDGGEESFGAIERSLDRMEGLVDSLLALAREGRSRADLEPVELAAVADDCRPIVEALGGRLVDDADRRLLADGSRLRQLVENLVRNAVEHGEGEVTVRIGDTPDGFYVEDDGPGIPEAERDRVFEPGYSTNDGGTGLGLDIVGTVADAHGWRIEVTEREGGGTRFEFSGVDSAA